MKTTLKKVKKILELVEQLQDDKINFNGVVFDSQELDRIYSNFWEVKETIEEEINANKMYENKT